MNNETSPRHPHGRIPVQSLIFFTLFYLYFWLEIDLSLVYHGGLKIIHFPAFFTDAMFFGHYTGYPAGLLEYLSACLSQTFACSWAGALVVTAQAWLMALCTASLLKAMQLFSLRGVHLIGPLFLLALYAGYNYHFNITMMVLSAMLLALAYAKLRPASDKAAIVLFFALHAAAYAFTAGGHLLYAALGLLYELLQQRRWRMALAFLASTAAVPLLVGSLGFGVTPAFAPSLFAPLEPHMYPKFSGLLIKLSSLYLFLPLTLLALWLLNAKLRALNWRHAGFALPFLLGAAVIPLFRNAELKTELKVGYYAYHRMWPELLEVGEAFAEKREPMNPCILHAVNRALYHTGRMGHDLFRYPQTPDALLLSGPHINETYAGWHRFDTLLDLGQINFAEHHLNVCIGFFGPRPIFLKRLALVHRIKGDLPTARIYLGALARTLHDTDEAIRTLALLKTDPDLQIRHLRSLRPEQDRPVLLSHYRDPNGFVAMERMLLDLLEKNPENRMAFEYLMALYLLNKRLDPFVARLSGMKKLGYAAIPPLYEEADLAHALDTQGRLPSQRSGISAGGRDRAERFLSALLRFRNHGDRTELKAFTNTYFYYYFCVGAPPPPR